MKDIVFYIKDTSCIKEFNNCNKCKNNKICNKKELYQKQIKNLQNISQDFFNVIFLCNYYLEEKIELMKTTKK